MTTPRRPRQIVEAEGRRAILVPGDLGDKAFCDSAVQKVIDTFGRLDVLVNNAGEQHPDEDIRDITEEQLKRTFQSNIYSMFFMVQAALPAPQGGRGDHQLHVGDDVQGRADPARLFVDQGRDHRLHPLAVAKPRRQEDPRQRASRRGRSGPRSTRRAASRPRRSPTSARTRRWGGPGQPNEVAPAFLFLACEDSSYMTGQVLHPNGGTVVNG